MRRFVLRGLGCLGLLVLILILAFGVLAWQVDSLGRRDEARAADVLVVLGARVNPDGAPGSDLTSRTLHAVDLFKAGRAPQMICAGGVRNERLSAAAVCRRYAIELGVPGDSVWIADGSSDTAGDAQVTAELMRQHGWRSAILVSHPLHLFRARWFFRQEGVDVQTSPTTTDTTRIDAPLRIWYAVREAGAIVITTVERTGWLPQPWKDSLKALATTLP